MTPWLDEQHIEIAAAPEVIYRYLADFNRHPGWSLSVTRVEPPAGGKFIVGAEFAMSGAAPGETWACRVMALQAPMRIAWEARGKHTLEQWEFLIVPSASATTLALRLALRPDSRLRWVFRDRRGARRISAENRACLSRIKAILEAGDGREADPGAQPTL